MLRLAVRVHRRDSELVLAELLELAPNGVEEVDVNAEIVEFAVYGAPGEIPELPALRAAARGALVEVTSTEIADDWAERWREFHRPLILGDRLSVRPPWEPPAATGLDIVIDPGRAFGTGAHATTQVVPGATARACARAAGSPNKRAGSCRPGLWLRRARDRRGAARLGQGHGARQRSAERRGDDRQRVGQPCRRAHRCPALRTAQRAGSAGAARPRQPPGAAVARLVRQRCAPASAAFPAAWSQVVCSSTSRTRSVQRSPTLVCGSGRAAPATDGPRSCWRPATIGVPG